MVTEIFYLKVVLNEFVVKLSSFDCRIIRINGFVKHEDTNIEMKSSKTMLLNRFQFKLLFLKYLALDVTALHLINPLHSTRWD